MNTLKENYWAEEEVTKICTCSNCEKEFHIQDEDDPEYCPFCGVKFDEVIGRTEEMQRREQANFKLQEYLDSCDIPEGDIVKRLVAINEYTVKYMFENGFSKTKEDK